jgi:hypothetical protein
MKKIILLLSLFIGLSSIAQDATKRFALLNEYKVKDMDIFRKNFPVNDAFARKSYEGIMENRAVHTSETGNLYNFSFVDGDENLGKFITKRGTTNGKFREVNPKIAEENSNNTDGAWRRSTWIRVNELEFLPADFKMEDYNFRKIMIRTVPANEQEAFEKVFSLTIANANQFGNNAYISPYSDVQDAQLEVVKIKPLNIFQAGYMAIQLFSKTIHTSKNTTIQSVKSLHIQYASKQPLHIDGEALLTTQETIEITMEPLSLLVVVPS